MPTEETAGAAGTTGATGTEPPKSVPYSRFAEVVKEKNDAVERAKTAEERATTADTLAGQVRELTTKLETSSKSWATEKAILAAGINDDAGIFVTRSLYETIPEKDRPSVADWLGTLKKDPSKAPRPLQPYLQAEVAAGAAGATTGAAAETKKEPEPQGKGMPRTTGTEKPAGEVTGETISAEKIRQAREHGQKTGDWTEYEKLRPQIVGKDPEPWGPSKK